MKEDIKLVAVVLATLAMAGSIIALSGCQLDTVETPVERIQRKSSIVVIDECQYIFMENGIADRNNYAFSLTHKGNCTNHIHSYNK
jgi:hypothetical protein